MNDFKIRIVEQLVRVVTVKSDNAAEALATVESDYKEGKHILDAEDFAGAEFFVDDPSTDEEGVCPQCGAQLEYGERESVDEGGVYFWQCPKCGATGREGYSEVFDGHHYCVRDKDGNPIPGRPD